MADMSDAGNALVALIAGILYPQGTAAASVTGDRLLVYQGWPDPVTLASDLAAGTIHVSVFPKPGDKVTSISQDDDDWEQFGNNGAVRELRRQTRLFQISIWAGVFTRRDMAATIIDAGLAAVSRLALADGSVAVMSYDSSLQDDNQQQAGIYRRDLLYSLNYATTQVMVLTAIAATVTDVTVGMNGADIATVSILS
ncbi:MAG: hypothetical protein M3N34_01010 [Pseudomonadota bacterium]|nr:hypothetical protein [Pseudomonadota bacterium]